MLGPVCVASGASFDVVLQHGIHKNMPTGSQGFNNYYTKNSTPLAIVYLGYVCCKSAYLIQLVIQ
jgi:hypothetical protein